MGLEDESGGDGEKRRGVLLLQKISVGTHGCSFYKISTAFANCGEIKLSACQI